MKVYKNSLTFIIITLFLILSGCQKELTTNDLEQFIQEKMIDAGEIIEVDNIHYIFYDYTDRVGIYSLKGKKSDSYIFGQSSSYQDLEVFLGSVVEGREETHVGLMVRDKNLLENTTYLKLITDDYEEVFPFIKDQEYYVLSSSFITRNFDYRIVFYNEDDEILFTWGNEV